jgi:hypothetical protein
MSDGRLHEQSSWVARNLPTLADFQKRLAETRQHRGQILDL